jgi:seryl-tRNA synthetase/acyl carrier protein
MNTVLPTPEEFERQLAHFINVTLLGGNGTVGRDTRLFEDGYMNSLRILDLIAVVEKTLGRRIPDRSVRLANFRSIATIVSAFHPDAASPGIPPAPPTDRLFERRTDRSRFASPIDALTRRGDVRMTSAGQAALSGLALDVFVAVDRTVARWASSLGATEHRYPSLIDLRVLERAGQIESFPQHLTVASHPERIAQATQSPAVIPSGAAKRRSRGIAAIPVEGPLVRDHGDSSTPQPSAAPLGMTTALAPAVCYHAYPEWEGKTLGPVPEVLTAVGRCYRYEGGNHVPLERLWDFTMREIIILGTRDQVEELRQSLVRHVSELVATLELDATIDAATDPFFTAGDEGRRLMQQAGALKHELMLTVANNGRAIAAASFNNHHDYFGTRFGISLAGGSPAHSGCVAFGLERWVLALLAQHGVNEHDWPSAARRWLTETRDEGARKPQPSGGANA